LAEDDAGSLFAVSQRRVDELETLSAHYFSGVAIAKLMQPNHMESKKGETPLILGLVHPVEIVRPLTP
jgi:hypothetical protein